MNLFAHQVSAFEELLARAQTYFEGQWRELQIRPRFHSLIAGPTGVGKTAIINLLATKTEAFPLRLSASGWMPAGAHQRAVQETIPIIADHLERYPRVILFVDEADKLYHENSWNSYIRGELYELLDGRWPVGTRALDESSDVEFPSEAKLELLNRRLNESTFIVGAGTFQDYFDATSENRSQIGFGSASAKATKAQISAEEIARRLPREFANRWNSTLVLIPELEPKHYYAVVDQAAKILPSWLRGAFRAAALRQIEVAISGKKGCRFIEEAVLEALQTVTKTIAPLAPEPNNDPCTP